MLPPASTASRFSGLAFASPERYNNQHEREDVNLKLTKQKKYLMLTILAVALIQMPQLSLTPAIDKIATGVFPGHSLSDVQEAFALVNFIMPVTSLLSAFLVGRGVFTKRGAMLGGLLLLFGTAMCALRLHTEFWHIRLLSVLLGVSVGLFLVNAISLLFDGFERGERQIIMGYQTSCVNVGGILLSLVGGALGAMIWYGGYVVLALGLPVAVLAFLAVPRTPRVTRADAGALPKKKLRRGCITTRRCCSCT
jgi:hypothetical protein